MDPSCLVTTVQACGGGVMVWGMFSWHTLGPLIDNTCCPHVRHHTITSRGGPGYIRYFQLNVLT